MEWDISLWAWVVIALAAFVGGIIQTIIGFGVAITAAPFVVMFAPQWMPVILTITALYLCISNVWSLRAHVDVKAMNVPIIVRVPASLLGAWALYHMDAAVLQVSVALAVIAGAIITASGVKFQATPLRLGVASFASGFMGTTTSIGGPPMALVMINDHPDKVRANLSYFFTIACVISLASYGLFGLLTWEKTLAGLSLLPGVQVGFYVGKKIRHRIPQAHFRSGVIILCLSSGGLALLSAFF